MKAAVAVLEPELLKLGEAREMGRVVLATVEGDIHEIGKTLVGTMLYPVSRSLTLELINPPRRSSARHLKSTHNLSA